MRERLVEAVFRFTRNIVKYRLLTDVSIRSDRFGRELMADLAARFVKNNQVPGAYLEFGVWRGSTFAQFYHTLRRHRLGLPMFGFDSFEGLPPPRGVDALAGFESFHPGQFRCSTDDFVAELRARWVPESAYTIVPGFYEDTLRPETAEKHGIERAALVWIDCVLYESARTVLRFLAPLLQDGTLLMFNDFFRFKGNPGLGERRALAEFLAEHPGITLTEYATFGSVGQAFIVHPPRNAAQPPGPGFRGGGGNPAVG